MKTENKLTEVSSSNSLKSCFENNPSLSLSNNWNIWGERFWLRNNHAIAYNRNISHNIGEQKKAWFEADGLLIWWPEKILHPPINEFCLHPQEQHPSTL